jgi:hypothetical protein
MKKNITAYAAMRQLIGKAITDRKIATTTTQGDFGAQDDYTQGDFTYRKLKNGPSVILCNGLAISEQSYGEHEKAVKQAFRDLFEKRQDEDALALIEATTPELESLLKKSGRKLSFYGGKLHVSAKPKKA